MALDKKILCPHMSVAGINNGQCVEDGVMANGEIVACRFWVHVWGKDPQTNEDIKRGDCANVWMPVLLIENSKVNRETGAAVESLRNEQVRNAQGIAGALLNVAEKVAEQAEAISKQPPTIMIANAPPSPLGALNDNLSS